YLLLDERSGTSVPLRVDYLFPYTRISPLKPLPPNRWFKLQYRLMTIHRPNGVKTYHAPMVVRFRTGARGLAVPRDRPRLVAVTQQPPHPATSSCGYQSRTAIFTVSSGLDRRMVGSFVWEVAYRRGRRWIPLRQFRPLEETIARTWALRRTLSVGSTQCSREPELGKGRYEVRVQLVRSDGQRWNTRSVRLAPLGRKRSKPRTGP
ncbi:MAG: hypothetical protein KC609_18225, partial [Myxococcales bacterium]|nr:hypothetical protein [Myxococcales bacterium]